KSAQIREILISESAWEEMTCLFAPSLAFLTRKPYYFAPGMSNGNNKYKVFILAGDDKHC
ncbi:hypothetical protein AIZ19_12820, partial [Salmonella enterica subsp. enterica serovar Typhimurium]